MEERDGIKVWRFKNDESKPSRLIGVGYNDFRIIEGCKIFRAQPHYTLHYVRNGKGKFFVKDKEYHIKEGDFFYTPVDEPMSYFPDESEPWRYYFFSLYGDYMTEIKETFGFTEENFVCPAKNPQKAKWVLDSLFKETDPAMEMYYTALSGLMQILSAESQTTKRSNFQSYQQKELVKSVVESIKLNYENPDFMISDVAGLLYVSHSRMSRIFRSEVGTTIVAYLMNYRLERAAELLTEHNMTVKSLSSAVGFNDEIYFMKCFKRKFGMTVGEYREHVKNAGFS